MKKIIDIKKLSILSLLVGLITMVGFISCEQEDPNIDTPITVQKVFLEDAKASVTDREVEFARLGQVIRLQGSGFLGLKKVYINGHDSYFNPTYITDNSMLVQVSRDVPTIEAADNVKNTIRLEKSEGNSFTYNFEIRASAPSITSITHTMPQAGEEITIYGSGLQEIYSIEFPGGVVVTDGIISDNLDGKFCTVAVPAGVSNEGGSILVIGANGGAYSPAYFNFKKGLLHNFDNVDNQSWSQGEISDDLTDIIPTTGNGPKSQGVYRSLNEGGKTMAASDAFVDLTRYWINNSVWGSILNNSVIPASTASEQVAIQMDIYVKGEWNSGNIRFVVADGYGASRYCMLYAPWEANGERIVFENSNNWFTITMPFSDSEDFEGVDFQSILNTVAGVTYAQSGPWLENGPYKGLPAESTNVNIYFDNIRVVPLNTPEYSDFSEDEE